MGLQRAGVSLFIFLSFHCFRTAISWSYTAPQNTEVLCEMHIFNREKLVISTVVITASLAASWWHRPFPRAIVSILIHRLTLHMQLQTNKIYRKWKRPDKAKLSQPRLSVIFSHLFMLCDSSWIWSGKLNIGRAIKSNATSNSNCLASGAEPWSNIPCNMSEELRACK